MKDHSKFYNWLRLMAVVNIVLGGFLLIWLIAGGAFVPHESDNLPSAFYASPAQRRMSDVLILVAGLSEIGFGMCDFMYRLKAVGVFAIVKAVSLVGLCLVYRYNPFIPVIAIAYFVCGIYAFKCSREEKNNLKLQKEPSETTNLILN